jgi:transcription elongation factor
MNDFPRTPEVNQADAVSSWTKSSLSHANGNCVEVADLSNGQVGMRDSKNTAGPALGFASEEWHAFLSGVRNGEFNFHAI